jgi:hypothetical protein
VANVEIAVGRSTFEQAGKKPEQRGEKAMSPTQTIAVSRPVPFPSKGRLWIGRTITSVVILFQLFDSIAKLMKERHVLEAAAELGYPANSMVGIGLLLLACTVVYVIPRTAVLGALLLTGYLGGAVATQVRVGNPVFECIFPILFGALVWAGLFLREEGLRAILGFRKKSQQ